MSGSPAVPNPPLPPSTRTAMSPSTSTAQPGPPVEQLAARLADPSTTPEALRSKLSLVNELRDNLENYQRGETEYRAFVDTILPVIVKILDSGEISMMSGSVLHRFRHALLETLHRLPHLEPLKTSATGLSEVLLKTMRNDNEENSTLAMKICIDLHRSYRDLLTSSVDSFLSIVKDMYTNMEGVVERIFSDEGPTDDGNAAAGQQPTTPALGAPPAERASSNLELPLGMHSFKLLQECPIAIVFLFQSYRDVVTREIQVFVPLIFEFLELQPRAQAQAREQAQQKGELFLGLAPSVVPKRVQFGDLLMAQVKTVSFLAYVIRVATGTLTQFRASIPTVAVRMLMDMPQEATGTRKELLVATRHILATDFRTAFVPHLDSLLDERVLVGNGTTSLELLRPLAYSMIADLVHHVRNDLSTEQLSTVVHTYSCNVHDSTLPNAIQTMCCKLLLNVIENIVTKDREQAATMLYRMFEAFVRKIEGLAEVRKDLAKWSRPRDLPRERGQLFEREYDDVDLERARPVAAVNNMTDSMPDSAKTISDARFMFRTIIVGVRTIIGHLKMQNMAMPDAVLLGRLFRAGARCMSMYDGVRREEPRRGDNSLKEIMDIYSGLFIATDLLVFQEVFENNISFYVDEVLENHELLQITQHLLSEASISQAFVGIIFRFFVAKLDSLGSQPKDYTTIILRIFKMACMAVTIFPETNEAVLQPHLCTFIMSSLRLASKAKEPSAYYLLMRTLFRSIGGGRFEILYKEVLPLLQTLLENLNGLINSAERTKRDLFIELCLTVPVRLSVLLPYLNYLMKPLVLALQGGPELVAQGLRTLELCVDNLTHEFLSPVLAPFLHEVMAGLWRLLKPLPNNHQHAHTTLRILGKLGGRNRRLLGPPKLEWRPAGEDADLAIHFEGRPAHIRILPMVDLANRMFRRHDHHYQRQAYHFLRHAAVSFLSRPTLPSGEPEEVLNQIIRGLFEASRLAEFAEEAHAFINNIAHHVFAVELCREVAADSPGKHAFPFSSCLVESMVENLASVETEHLEKTADHTVEIVKILLAFRNVPSVMADLPVLVLHQLANKLCSLCFEQSWYRKTGGATGIDLLSKRIDFGAGSRAWLVKHEADFVRALLFMLKDMPRDPPANIEEVAETLLHVLRTCNVRPSGEDAMEVDAEKEDRKRRAEYLVGLLIVEVSSQVATVRDVAKRALQILADVAGVSLTSLCLPVRERLLTPIYTKPLRALAFPMQVGFIDAVTFCITLDPPLIEFEDAAGRAQAQAHAAAVATAAANNEAAPPPLQGSTMNDHLARLLMEALGIADADDQALTGRHTQHRQTALLVSLRVVCVKLLSAALLTVDLTNTRHQQMRTRILSTYFKLLYSRSKEVVDAVYDSLRQCLERQGKLPKELLQSGLRPVLMNLSDHKRLSVPSLTGLARLLELLTNYFKVEIGTKLLDHFRALASDVQALTLAALNPQNENSELAIMASVVNIFRLLPHPAAAQFLDELVTMIVGVETQLKKDGATPFTKPLAGFLDRYPNEACEFYFARLGTEEDFARSICALMGADESGTLRAHVTQYSRMLLAPAFDQGSDQSMQLEGAAATAQPPKKALHVARLLQVIIARDPSWIVSNAHMIEPMIQRWISPIRRERRLSEGRSHLDQLAEDDIILDIFLSFLRQAEHIDLLFHIVDLYTFRSPSDYTSLSRFFYHHVISSRDISFKQRILYRFVEIFESPSVSQEHKTMALRYVVNPILSMAESRGAAEVSLIDRDYILLLGTKIWQHAADQEEWRNTMIPSEAIKIELLHMLTVLTRHWPDLIAEQRKSVIRFGWTSISEHDATVKHVGYVLTAYFLARIESPARICMLTYTGLLRTHASEMRSLSREALDVLIPSMPARMAAAAGTNAPGQQTDWLNSTRRVIADEAWNQIPMLVHIYQTFVRHADVYYPRRDWFLPGIVNSLPKFSLVPQAAGENRILAVDLVELIIKWEKKRIESNKADEASSKMDVDGAEEVGRASPKRIRLDRAGSAAPSNSSSAHGIPPPPLIQRDSIVSTLIRIINLSPEVSSKMGTNVPSRSIALLSELIGPEIWPDVSLKVGFFQRSLLAIELTPPETAASTQSQPGQPSPADVQRAQFEAGVTTFCNTLEALNVAVIQRPDEWTTSNVPILQTIVDKAVSCNEARVHLAARPLLQRIFATLPPPPATDEEAMAQAQSEASKSFFDWATNTVNQGLVQQPQDLPTLHGTLILLEAWSKHSAAPIDFAMSSLVRVLTRLTKDHVASTAPVPNDDPALRMLITMLELTQTRVNNLGEQRRWLLSALVLIVEKSSNFELLRFVLEMTRKWVIEKSEPFPAIKEKAGILCKMLAFESRPGGEELLKEFLQLILEIYSDPYFARSELTVRLESAFLLGCKNRDPTIRGNFLKVFDNSISHQLFPRMHYIVGVQNWEQLAESNWIHQALDLLFGAVDGEEALYSAQEAPAALKEDFTKELAGYKMQGLVDAARKLLYADASFTHTVWISLFGAAWSCLSRREQADMTRFLTSLVSKDYHLKSLDRRPNNVQALMNGLLNCTPLPTLPPHLVRYLGKTFGIWHASLEMLSETVDEFREDDEVRESTLDAMAEMYGDLAEDDLFYGLWRRRCYYAETNCAVSFEQNGMWQQAEHMYEAAQAKARNAVMPYTESEYALWEDHWVMCAQKLQQWDILTDLAKHEGNNELSLECAWRLTDWVAEREQIETAIKGLNPAPTPRKRVYEAYMALVRSRTSNGSNAEDKKNFERALDDGMQLALRKWFYLPDIVGESHVPLLQLFQQFVELQEAGGIFGQLATTTATNLDARSQELKNTLMTWRERLPNLWDDINVWSDIVAWRQHVFSAINSAYMPLVPQGGQGAQSQNNNSHAYRGFHEAAWIINRFAHVARKHELSEVCLSSLTKIYTLPNIEIQEAFLKLREQAKCHFQNPSELTQGLEVISNTNLSFFGPAQKAEFFTLKGMYLAKLGMHDEVSTVFNQALTMDMTYPKAWAEWGDYHDRRFRQNPDLDIAAQAVNCYLQAAGLYKSPKVRKLLTRILWLLGLDDERGTVSKAFDMYKGDVPVWYWITFIPQLLASLANREAKYARVILMKIAKAFPQSLYFLLRTQKEEHVPQRIVYQRAQQQKREQQAAAEAATSGAPSTTGDGASESGSQTTGAAQSPPRLPPPPGIVQPPPQLVAAMQAAAQQGQSTQQQMVGPNGQLVSAAAQAQPAPRQAWDHVDEIVAILKTAFPLLALSMETFCDQVTQRFKQSADEDIYRLINALLYDAFMQYNTTATKPDDPGLPSPTTLANVARVAEKLNQQQFFDDFVNQKPTLAIYIQRLQRWRDRYEAALDRKPRRMSLENSSHWLVEFPYHRFDEIEVPGQYLKMEDSNMNFVRIDHFLNKFDFTRSGGTCWRRITFVGNDGTFHPFAIQLPAPRHARREERIAQLFRMLNDPLTTRKETRKRNLSFTIPLTVPLAPSLRLVQNDASNVALLDVWEQHCRDKGMGKDDPVIAFRQRVYQLVCEQKERVDIQAIRLEAFEEVALKMFPDDVLKKFMMRSMATASDLWHIRKQMTAQFGAYVFMTNVFCMTNRTPARILFSRSTGSMHTLDMLPSLSAARPNFTCNEPVPFRFTPNLQKWFGVIGIEGVLTSSILAIARSLTDHDGDLEHRLSIFVREEVVAWHQIFRHRLDDSQMSTLRDLSLHSVDEVVARARLLSCKTEREKSPHGSVPANQSIVELITAATNPISLAQLEVTSLPWL